MELLRMSKSIVDVVDESVSVRTQNNSLVTTWSQSTFGPLVTKKSKGQKRGKWPALEDSNL